MKYKNFKYTIQTKKLLIHWILLIPLILFAAPTAKAAEQSLRVSPVIINISLSPDKTYTHDVTVENLTDTPMPLRASFNDFITTGEEGGYVFENTKTNPLLAWTKLNETEFILNPKEKKKLQLTIHTPKSIPLGGYYGILFFEPVLPNAMPNATQINAKVGILMLANVGVPDPKAPKAEILTFETGRVHSDGNLPLTLRVKNISLNFFTAKPVLTISPIINLTGIQERHIVLDDKIIFPGLVRRWTEDPAVSDLSPNIYKVNLTIATGENQSVSKSTYVMLFPFLPAIGALILLFIVVFLINKRSRLKKALAALIK